MRPVLFHLGDFPLYSYSAFVVIAYFACLTYGWIAVKKKGLDLVPLIDLSLILFITGIIGARLLFVIVYFDKFQGDLLSVFKIWQGGLVYYGGLITAVASAMAYIKIKRLDFWTWSDLLSPAAMLMLVFGRIGCFLNGCCYGRPTDSVCGVVYPLSHPKLGLSQQAVHPTPLYESAAALTIFGALLLVESRKKFKGQTFWTMAAMYSVARFTLEFFRGDPRGEVLGMSSSQFISVMTAIVSVAALNILRKKHVEGAES